MTSSVHLLKSLFQETKKKSSIGKRLKIFSTGSITVTAPSVANVQAAIEHIYPKVFEFQKKKELADIEAALQMKRDKDSAAAKRKLGQTNGFRKIKKPNIGDDDDDDSDY